jgi:hypothetical protein
MIEDDDEEEEDHEEEEWETPSLSHFQSVCSFATPSRMLLLFLCNLYTNSLFNKYCHTLSIYPFFFFFFIVFFLLLLCFLSSKLLACLVVIVKVGDVMIEQESGAKKESIRRLSCPTFVDRNRLHQRVMSASFATKLCGCSY